VDPVRNLIVITSGNQVLWNGKRVTLDQLRENLERSRTLAVEPELQFVPEPQASYELSTRVLNVIRDSGVTKFGFVGNEKYRVYPEAGEQP
jgi:biopolymer transport protein ExbD